MCGDRGGMYSLEEVPHTSAEAEVCAARAPAALCLVMLEGQL